MDIKNKNITIIGAGISGIGAAQLAFYFGANVFLSDEKNIHHNFKQHIAYEEGGHTEKCYKCDFAIVSPGIATDNSFFNQFFLIQYKHGVLSRRPIYFQKLF